MGWIAVRLEKSGWKPPRGFTDADLLRQEHSLVMAKEAGGHVGGEFQALKMTGL